MGSDESHFNVLLIVRDKVTRQCPQTTTFEEKADSNRGPSACQPNALPLSQTGSLDLHDDDDDDDELMLNVLRCQLTY